MKVYFDKTDIGDYNNYLILQKPLNNTKNERSIDIDNCKIRIKAIM